MCTVMIIRVCLWRRNQKDTDYSSGICYGLEGKEKMATKVEKSRWMKVLGARALLPV